MSKAKNEKLPVIFDEPSDKNCVQTDKLFAFKKFIFPKENAIKLDCSIIFEEHKKCLEDNEDSNKKETTITTNFSTPPRPKK